MDNAKLTELDNPFWQFSIILYKNELIRQDCLHFQEQEGVNVNLILLACWLSYRVEPVLENEFKPACQSVVNWQKKVTQPLRNTRQYLKTLAENNWVNSFYQLILNSEIQSESYQQDYLYRQFANKLQISHPSNPEILIQRYLFWLFEEMQIAIDDELRARTKDFIDLIQQALMIS